MGREGKDIELQRCSESEFVFKIIKFSWRVHFIHKHTFKICCGWIMVMVSFSVLSGKGARMLLVDTDVREGLAAEHLLTPCTLVRIFAKCGWKGCLRGAGVRVFKPLPILRFELINGGMAGLDLRCEIIHCDCGECSHRSFLFV